MKQEENDAARLIVIAANKDFFPKNGNAVFVTKRQMRRFYVMFLVLKHVSSV